MEGNFISIYLNNCIQACSGFYNGGIIFLYRKVEKKTIEIVEGVLGVLMISQLRFYIKNGVFWDGRIKEMVKNYLENLTWTTKMDTAKHVVSDTWANDDTPYPISFIARLPIDKYYLLQWTIPVNEKIK